MDGRVPGVSPGAPPPGRVAGRAKSTVPGRLPGVSPDGRDEGALGRVPTDGPVPVDGRLTPPAGRDGIDGRLLKDGERPIDGEGRE
jgi:hypothetical protein